MSEVKVEDSTERPSTQNQHSLWPGESWESIRYFELQRKVTDQAKTENEIAKRASRLLRTILTTFGIVIAALSLSIRTGADEISSLVSGASVESTVQELSNVFQQEIAQLIVVFLFISLSFALYSGLRKLIIEVPSQALELQRLSKLRKNSKLQEPRCGSISKIKKELSDEYHQMFQQNSALVGELKHRWDQCVNTAKKGVEHTGLAVLIFSTIFITRSAGVVIPTLGLVLIMSYESISSKIQREQVAQFTRIRRSVDGPTVIVFILAFAAVTIPEGFEMVQSISSVLFVLAFLIAIYLIYDKPNKTRVFIRNLVLTPAILLLLFSAEAVVGPRRQIVADLTMNDLAIRFATSSTLVLSLVFIAGIIQSASMLTKVDRSETTQVKNTLIESLKFYLIPEKEDESSK
ncbi:hypothetical protein [Haloferax sp. DFSO60]|uniref:hypothetical protein n=1 Tax=Haloferax sp. DFSO60 TaxID=3388652 RepID=UPI00397B1777